MKVDSATKVLAATVVASVALATASAAATDYWAFGDSITRGEGNGFNLDPAPGQSTDCLTPNPYPSKCAYHWRLENALTLAGITSDVVNRGIAGEGTATGKTRIDDAGEPLETSRCTDPDASDVLLLMEGTNDLGLLLTADIATNLEEILDLATGKCVHSAVASTIRLLKAGTLNGSKEGDWNNPLPTDLKTAISTLAGDKNRAFVNVWLSLCPNQPCYGFTQPPTTNFWGRLGPGDPGHVSYVGYDTMSPLFEAAILADPLPGAATLTGPSGDVTDNAPVFTWSEHAHSDWYFLEVDAGAGYERWHPEEQEQIMGVDICTGGTCTFDPGVVLADGDHTWRVRTRNLRGVGSWSASTAFKVWTTLPGSAALTAPTGDGCEGTAGPYTQTFDWTEASDAKDYRLQVVEDPSMIVVIDETFAGTAVCAGPNCSFTPGTTLPVGEYTWKVMATNPFGNGPWSADTAFSLFPTALSAPTQMYPLGDLFDTMPTTPTYSWIATAGSENYDLDINGGVTLHAADAVCSGSTCSVTGAALAVGTHSWEVTAKNRCNVVGTPSGTTPFDILACLPPTTRDLAGATVGGTLLETACVELIAGNLGPYTVASPGGDVTFHAGDKLTIHNGFTVEQDASFTAIVDK